MIFTQINKNLHTCFLISSILNPLETNWLRALSDLKRSINHVHSQSNVCSAFFFTIDNIRYALEYSPVCPSNKSTVVPVRYEMNLYIKFISVLIYKCLKMLSISKNVYTHTHTHTYIYIYNPMIGRISK